MEPLELFAKLGLFAAPGFLPSGSCARLVREMGLSATAPARVLSGGKVRRAEAQRRGLGARVSPSTFRRVRARLLSARPALERHFGVRLTGAEPPQFLLYRRGDYFRPHRDRSPGRGAYPKGQSSIGRRKVSVVVFLNASGRDYRGGELVFYGLLGGSRLAKIGLELPPQTGLLIAFPSTLRHEVTPVRRGRRFSLVSWFS